jgi:hypothetical protein
MLHDPRRIANARGVVENEGTLAASREARSPLLFGAIDVVQRCVGQGAPVSD